ncbi:hypothetical protein [Fodinibius roseus]|uniref:hypothetical protein n=1 Tax=Fodinibius roseus TaxID=1194090 RepID=UPI000934FB6A|nr:hypothetical protein [Fodinibius roseus]
MRKGKSEARRAVLADAAGIGSACFARYRGNAGDKMFSARAMDEIGDHMIMVCTRSPEFLNLMRSIRYVIATDTVEWLSQVMNSYFNARLTGRPSMVMVPC